jgi:hypothetical protein
MIVTWKTNYLELLRNTRLLSQLSCFLLTMFALLSLYDFGVALEHVDNSFLIENRSGWIPLAIFFHLVIAVAFFLRFCFLWSVKVRQLWLSQLLWLFGFATIYMYSFLSTGSVDLVKSHNCMDCIWYETFKYSSEGFTQIFLLYLFLSPFKELIFLVVPLFQSSPDQGRFSDV